MGYSAKTITNVLMALGLTLAVGIVGVTTFLGAQFSQIQTVLQNDTPREQAEADALDRLQTRLGPGGFLFHFSEFARTGQPDTVIAMRSTLAGAESALREFESLPQKPATAALGYDLRNSLTLFAATLKSAEELSSGPTSDFAGSRGLVLANTYATLESRLTAYQQDNLAARTDKLAATSARFQAVAMTAAGILLLMALLVSWFTRSRVLNPLIEVEHSVFNLSEGDVYHPVWGTHRNDEIGALARAIDRVRTQVAKPAQNMAAPSVDMTKMGVLEARYTPLFENALRVLAQASDTLKARADAVGHIVDTTQAELTTTAIRVGDTCASVEQTAHDMQEILHLAATAMIGVKEHMEESGLQASTRLANIVERMGGQVDSVNNQTNAIARAGAALEAANKLIQSIAAVLESSEQKVRNSSITLAEAADKADHAAEHLDKTARAAPSEEKMQALEKALRQTVPGAAANTNKDEDIRRALSDMMGILAAKLQAMTNQINDLRLSQSRGVNAPLGTSPAKEPPATVVQAFPPPPPTWPTAASIS